MRALSLLSCLVALGCAAVHPRPADPGLALLPPGGAGFTGTLVQAVDWSHGDAHLQAQVVTEVSPQEVRLVALSPLGQRVLSLRWDGKHLEREQDPHLPSQFPAQLVLRDFQLTFWREQAIRQALPPGWTLTASGGERLLTEAGRPVIRIRYGSGPFQNPIQFEHLTFGYHLEIRTADRSE